jgi:hypothetical protein
MEYDTFFCRAQRNSYDAVNMHVMMEVGRTASRHGAVYLPLSSHVNTLVV